MDLRLKDVADLLQVSEKTVYRWVQSGKIPAYRLNHQYRFDQAELENWLKKNKIELSQADAQITPCPVSLSELLARSGIYTGVEGTTVRGIITASVEKMKLPDSVSRTKVITSLLEREEMMPTAVGKGIAVPHPRNPILTDVADECMGLFFLKDPVDYGAVDREKVSALFIVLSAHAKRHLEILSKISFLTQQQDFICLLRDQSNPEMIMEYIRNQELGW